MAIHRPRPVPVQLVGKVTGVDAEANTFTMDARGGEWTIQVTADTRIIVPGVASPTVANIVEGDKAIVTGLAPASETVQNAAERTLVAQMVAIQRPQPRPIKVGGTVARIDVPTGRFVLALASGETKIIVVNDGTRLVIPGVREPSLEDVNVGDRALVMGMIDETAEGSPIVAQMIVVHQPIPRPGRVRGEVVRMAVDDPAAPRVGTLVIETADGRKIVKTTAETRFCVPEVEQATLEDIEIGDEVIALGLWNVDNELVAKIVAMPDCALADELELE